VSLEYPTKVMIDGAEIDGVSFIKSKYRIRK